MPRALAIETSGRVGSVAVVEDGRVLAESEFPHGLKHAAGILPMIDGLCRQQHWAPRDLSELYISAGPGSFTGLRIGITLVKTLAFVTGAKVVAVPTAEVLVRNAPAEARQVIIVLDAKRGQIFTARFEGSDGKWVTREPAHLDDLASMLRRAPRPVHLLGEGIPYHEGLVPAGDSSIVVTAPEIWRARAGVVAQIGMEMARVGRFTAPEVLIPIYIRRPEAEEKFEQKGTVG